MKALSVYIHIPFCVRKCNYCDFLSSKASEETIGKYLDALRKEIREEASVYEAYEIQTVFFGGGTPSIVDAEAISDILELLKTFYHMANSVEITMEMNPATATEEKMRSWKEAGVNRLSIGLQSCEDAELKLLGRVHSYQEFLDTYALARAVGFDNINIDLMSALPGQTIQTWENTLQKVISLEPQHISAYSLIVEEGTHLYEHLEEYPALPSEEEDREMYQLTKEILARYGYERYEISNYAKKGYSCKHNCVYWTRGNYVGFGLGASSMVENVRWKNTEDFHQYVMGKAQDRKEEKEHLTTKECMEEFMFLGLRMMKGVSKQDFFHCFHEKMDQVYQNVLEKWYAQNMLVVNEDTVRLTEEGIDISNVIFSDFLS